VPESAFFRHPCLKVRRLADIRPVNGAGTVSRRTYFFGIDGPLEGAPVRLAGLLEFGEWRDFMQIIVRDNNVDQALRALKKKLQREGVYREMKLRRHYEKPSEKRARERAAAIRRARKLERKRIERDGGPR
jgi:small subunit ribosomal protein S21